MSKKTKAILFISMSALGFALMAFFVRLSDELGPFVSSFQKSFFRNIISLFVALFVFLKNKNEISKKITPTLCLRSLLGTVGIFANFYALSYIPIAEGQSLNKTAPIFTVIFSWLFLQQKPSKQQFFTICLGFLGVLLILKPGFAGSASLPLLVGLLGGVCAGGAYTCLGKLAQERCNPAFIVLFFSAFSTILSIPFVLINPCPMNFYQLLTLTFAGIGAAIGQFGITLAYKYAKAREIAVFDYSNLLFTGILGFIFFNQLPDIVSIIGMMIIIIAALLRSR